MNLQHRFVLDSPAAELPWGIGEAGFLALIGAKVKRVTAGHYRVRGKAFGGIEHEVNFYFKPSISGGLRQVELKRTPSRHRRKNFEEWQARLESALGPGNRRSPGIDDVLPSEWSIGPVRVEHNYYYNSGLFEQILLIHNAA
jgi:hypothetical protein